MRDATVQLFCYGFNIPFLIESAITPSTMFHSSGVAVRMISMRLYTCMESQDAISPSSSFARAIDNAVLPEAVGPAMHIKFFTRHHLKKS